MKQEQTKEQNFTLFTKTQAWIGLSSFVLAMFFAGRTFSQEVIPQLQMDEYNSNVMNQVYGQSYFLNSIAGWTDQVTYYKGLLRANWEAAADSAIYNYVSNITTSDSYNNVDAYKDYVQKELESQKIAALNTWEDRANLDFLENRNEFVLRLNTNRVDTTYLNRIGIQTTLSGQDTHNQALQLQQQIANASNQWSQNFNQNAQQGFNDFATSLQTIESQYSQFLDSMDESEATFQNNLNAIDSYKTAVKTGIKGIVDQFKGMLVDTCNQPDDCVYKKANQAGLNDAGIMLTNLIGRMETVLNQTTLDSSNILTSISTEVTSFLAGVRNTAATNTTSFANRIDTYQTTLNFDPSMNIYTTDVSGIISSIYSDSFGSVPDNQRFVAWQQSPGSRDFANIPEPLKSIFLAIRSDNMEGVRFLLNQLVGTGDRTVTSVTFANLYTDSYNMYNQMPGGLTGVSHTEGNFLRDRAVGTPYDSWWQIRPWNTTEMQMGAIGYRALYVVHDAHASVMADYWGSNSTSLTGQLGKYTNDINPAIRNWEGQVASYSSFYEQWKVNADALKAQAKADYENSLADLEAKKSAWVSKLETERQEGLIKWEEMQKNAANAESKNDLAALKSDLISGKSSTFDFSTGTESVLGRYEDSLTSLTTKEFVFQEPVQQQVIAQDTSISVKEFFSKDQSLMAISKIEVFDKVSTLGSFSLGGLASSIGLVQTDPTIYKTISLVESAAGAVGGFASSLTGSNTSGGQSFSIFNAASQKTVETSLKVDGKDIGAVFSNTANGVYQYAQLLSANENNERSADREQEKLLNQLTYGIKWEDRAVTKFNEKGEIVGDPLLTDLLKRFTEPSKYDTNQLDGCKAGGGSPEDCFNNYYKKELSFLKERGWEYQDGMIVKSLSRADKVMLGQTAGLDLSAEEKAVAGSCYVNPQSCKTLLRQDYTYTLNQNSNVATVTKIISDGKIAGKNSKGEYISGKQEETRYVSLSEVKPVIAPKGKDLFDVWGEEDWDDIGAQQAAVMSDFYSAGLAGDSKRTSAALNDIAQTESRNEKKFQEAKAAAEAADSFLKDMIMAYISGGIEGIKSSIKGKVEDQINSGLAAAFIRATGGSEDQIAMASQLVSFMRGKMQERKIKSNMAKNNLTNAAMGGLAIMTGGASMLLSGAMGAMAGVGNMIGSSGAMLGATFGSSMASFGLGATNSVYRAVAGDNAADAMMNRITGPKDQLAAIKANENAMIKSSATTAIASATGLPKDLVGQMLTDYQGSQAAKKTRDAMNSNPIGVIGSQVAGLAGGILKTAAVAMGAKERDIQKMLSDGNRMLYSGVIDSNLEAQSLAYLNQSLGMKAPGTSYTSNLPKDNAGIVDELGQRIVVDEIVKATGMDKDVADAAFRKQYGAIKQKKADNKAKNEAVRSTVITAVTTAATLGAGGAFGQTVLKGLTVLGAGSAQLGAAVINLGVQVVDGSRNGKEGMLAGFANGAIGLIGGKVKIPIGDKLSALTDELSTSLTSKLNPLLEKSLLGLGVSYDKQNGWGGSLGLGGAKANVSISFSQRGNTTVSGSMESGFKGIQLTASSTTNGATTIGANYNPNDKGPRQGWNLGANYDINGGGFSGSVGYTNSATGLGLTSTIDRNGLSTSGQLNGVNLATMTQDGFRYDEISWTDININKAQDATDEIRQKASNLATVKANMPDADVSRMSDNEIAELAGKITIEKENQQLLKSGIAQDVINSMSEFAREQALDRINNVVDVGTVAIAALTSLGTAALAFVGLGGTSNSSPIPTNIGARVVEVARRKTEDGVETVLDKISDVVDRVKDNLTDSIKDLSTDLVNSVDRMANHVKEIAQMPIDWWNDAPAVNPSVLSKADAALLAAAVYSDVPKDKKDQLLGKSENLFKILGPDDFSGTTLENLRFKDTKSGLDSMIVKRTATIDGVERTVYVYALAGTEGGPISQDGATNASAVVGSSTQYELALDNARKIQKYLKEHDPSAIIMTTGHSLGGGMAASISLQTGIPAITFNPAGTNFLTNGISNAFNTGWNQIDAYITPTDPLNTLVQRPLFPFIGPNGRTHTETIMTPSGIFKGHKIENFVDHYFKNENTETVNPMKLIEIPHATVEGSAGGFAQAFSETVYEPLKKKIPNKVKDSLNSVIRNTSMGFGYSPVVNESTVGNKPEVASRPLNVSEISNSSATLQQRFIEAVELPNVNDFKKGGSLKLEFSETTPPEKIHETIEKIGTQMIKDAYFNYDASIKSKDLLEKFAKENGLNTPSSTPEQKQLYQKLQSELNATIKNAKVDPLKARIDYTRENYARITAETLVNRYGDKIDTENSTDRVTVLKNGEGMILNQVAYDSQRDNTSKIEFSDYTLYPGNECSPTSTSIVAEYMGATSQNGMYQFVDDFIKQANNDGVLVSGTELKEDKYLKQVLAKYDQKLIDLKVDLVPISGISPTQYKPDPNNWKTDSIKKALSEGKPVVVGGEFNVSPVIGGHRLVIVGYDSTGWIVHDPYGNANNTSYQGSGMYAHYDFGKWDIGKKTAFVIENIQKEK
ncbi:hypothetical protein LPTSP3_g04810 [Leptospira kobayashii]|uniref:Peptidase C39-like domain-containing protein n=1 Tax=Leptospira kobayashii TaxID=1917830 RepID=A0ABM7UGF3_9LEPT|nr:TIGR04388 family protein [Leptospira kobayashii]BDA77551.1 hypothetical protein LPTSP3_g04810 [Leptospira kobayashii]